MNTYHDSSALRPIIGRISVIVNRLRPGLTGWDIQDAQREGLKHLVGYELDIEDSDTYPVSIVRAGIKPEDTQEVVFTPSGIKEPLSAGMGYVMLISYMPDAEPWDFTVLGFTPADVFMRELKKFKDHKANPPKKAAAKNNSYVRKDEPMVQNLDQETIYRLKGNGMMFSGTAPSICMQAMSTFGSTWRKDIREFQWFKKEGLKYSPTPSKRPEYPIDNQMAIDIGNNAKQGQLVQA